MPTGRMGAKMLLLILTQIISSNFNKNNTEGKLLQH